MQSQIEMYCKTCHQCQVAKKKIKKYRKVPPKLAEIKPWHNVQIDCIGPYTVKHKYSRKIIKHKLRALTMIDPVTS